MDIAEKNGLLLESNLKELGINALFLYSQFTGNSYVFYFTYCYGQNKDYIALKNAVNEIAKYHNRDIFVDRSLYSDFRIISRYSNNDNNPPHQEDIFTQFAIESAKRGVRLVKQTSRYDFNFHYCTPYYTGYHGIDDAFDAVLRLFSGLSICNKYQKPDGNGFLSLSYKSSAANINSSKIDQMSGIEFENHLLQSLAKRCIRAEITKETGDQGVDIIAKTNYGNVAIQCKRYKESVGNSAVQEVTAGMKYYKCNGGIVITNNFFSKSAIELAKACAILLIDKKTLSDFLANPSKYLNASISLNNK